jgi:hypothetical protein
MSDWTEENNIQYRITYDQAAGVFRILNTWHDSVKNLPIDTEIPDNSPAMKILSSLEVNALLGILNSMGWIKKIFGDQSSSNPAFLSSEPRKSIQEIAIENITKIASLGGDEGVAKESVMAIREVVNKV